MAGGSSRLACCFHTLVGSVGGGRLRPGSKVAARRRNAVADLARRDLADIAAGVEALPGTWRVETNEGDAVGKAGAWLRPLGDDTVPAFGIARGDGIIMVRMNRTGEIGNAGSLVFGAFGSVVAALDAIHNDVAAIQTHGRQVTAGAS